MELLSTQSGVALMLKRNPEKSFGCTSNGFYQK